MGRVFGVEQELAPHAERIDHGVVVVAHDVDFTDVVFVGKDGQTVAHFVDGRAAHADGFNGDQQDAAAAGVVVEVDGAGVCLIDPAEAGLIVAVAGHPVARLRQRPDGQRFLESGDCIGFTVGAQRGFERRTGFCDGSGIGGVIRVKRCGTGCDGFRVERRIQRQHAVQKRFPRGFQRGARICRIGGVRRVDGEIGVHRRAERTGQRGGIKRQVFAENRAVIERVFRQIRRTVA